MDLAIPLIVLGIAIAALLSYPLGALLVLAGIAFLFVRA